MVRNRIKKVLSDKEKSGQWLSSALKKQKSTVSRWSNNKSQPTLKILYEIAILLEVDIRELLEPTPNGHPGNNPLKDGHK